MLFCFLPHTCQPVPEVSMPALALETQSLQHSNTTTVRPSYREMSLVVLCFKKQEANNHRSLPRQAPKPESSPTARFHPTPFPTTTSCDSPVPLLYLSSLIWAS